MRRYLSILLLTGLLAGCQERGTLDLGDLEQRARQGDSAALARLVELLGRSEGGVNDRVYPVLVDLGSASVPFLLEAVKASDPERREHAIAALGTLQAREAVEPVAQVLGETSLGRRYVAAWALGEIGDPRGIPALIAALEDEQSEVRRYATRALIRLNRKAVPPLLDYLEEAGPLGASGAILALGDIADPASVEPLLARAGGPNREEVLLALGKLKDPRAEAVLIEGLADPSWRVRMHAAMALGPLGGERAVEPLRTTLEDDVKVVREWSARSLEMITGEPTRYRDAKGEYVRAYNVYH